MTDQKSSSRKKDRRTVPRGAFVPAMLALGKGGTMIVPAKNWPGVAAAASRWGPRLKRRWKGRRIVTEHGVSDLYLVERMA